MLHTGNRAEIPTSPTMAGTANIDTASVARSSWAGASVRLARLEHVQI